MPDGRAGATIWLITLWRNSSIVPIVAPQSKIMAQGASWEAVFETYKDRVSLDLLGEIRARVEGTDREADDQ